MHKYITTLKSTGKAVTVELAQPVEELGPKAVVEACEKMDLTPTEKFEAVFWMASLYSTEAVRAVEALVLDVAMGRVPAHTRPMTAAFIHSMAKAYGA